MTSRLMGATAASPLSARSILLLTKLDAPDRLPHYLSDLLVICRGGQRAAVAACMPMAALPRPLYALVRRVVRRSRGMSMEDPSFDEFRL